MARHTFIFLPRLTQGGCVTQGLSYTLTLSYSHVHTQTSLTKLPQVCFPLQWIALTFISYKNLSICYKNLGKT